MLGLTFGIISLAIAILIPICTSIKRAMDEDAAAAAQAAQARAAAEKIRMREEQVRIAKQNAEQRKAEQAAISAAKKAEREQKQAAAHAQKVARAAELAELAERRLQAEKELAELKKQTATDPEPEPEPVTPENHSENESPVNPIPKPFKGKTFAFTGRLTVSGMTRAQAIEKVIAAGGYADKNMPASTNYLVVGSNPGTKKMEKAAEWISQVKKITEEQFLDMLNAAA